MSDGDVQFTPTATVCGNPATAAAQSLSRSPWATSSPSRHVKLNHAESSGHADSASPMAWASERGEGFESQQVGPLGAGRASKNLDPPAVELDQFRVGEGVVAVVFGAVVQSRSIGSERCCDNDPAARKCNCRLASQRHRSQQRGIGSLRREADLGIADAGNLVAGGLDALRACLDVGAVDGNDFLRRFFQHVSRPERAIDARSQVFELRGQAAIEHMNAIQDRTALIDRSRHGFMLASHRCCRPVVGEKERVGFVVSHPFARKNAKGWGTEHWILIAVQLQSHS
jgi:hypothetical protein